jgi:RHS repeat-associated protein
MNRIFKALVWAGVALPALTASLLAQADTKVQTRSYEYDASGQLTKETIEPGNPSDCLQTTFTYDKFGNKVGTSAAACAGAAGYTVASAASPRTAASTFSAEGRFALSNTNALGQAETKTYDPNTGKPLSLTGPNGLTTRWTYDSLGRKTRETRADGTFTTWADKLCTDSGANCPASVGPASVIWLTIEQAYAANGIVSAPEKRQYYDRRNRVVRAQTQGFDGATAAPTLVQDFEYNPQGQVARQSAFYALAGGSPIWTTYAYDALGRVVRESVPDPAATGGMATTTFAYSALSSTATNAKGQTKTTTKDVQGHITRIVDAQGSSIVYTYDAAGNLTQTNAAGSITTLAYNTRGQKTSMVDPAMGAWEYRYNAFGELVWQRDSLNQAVTLAYDNLGRLTQRTEPDLVSQWSYDKKFDGTACGKSIGKLCEAKADNGYNRKHTYDALGRVSATATALDNAAVPATVTETYDPNTGRVATKTWPTGYQASYTYSPLGYLKAVAAGGTAGFTQTVRYDVLAMNPLGQVTQYKTGNQVTTVKTYNPTTNRLTGMTATRDGQAAGNILNQADTYDALGNLATRADNTAGVATSETYSHDSLNRLSLATILGGGVSPPQTTQVMYDARGNITYKSDVGRYWYDPARPNRMTNVTLETAPGAQIPLTGTRTLSYAFDDLKPTAQTVGSVRMGNGNLEYTVSRDTVNNRHSVRSETYTSFGMPRQIVYGNFITSTSSTADRTLSFVHGPEHQRIKQTVALTGNGTSAYSAGTTWYLNGIDSLGLSYEKEVKANGLTENRHYVAAGGTTFALFVSRTGTLGTQTATTTSYFQHDHLGSIVAVTDETGVVKERLAYDPWGKRRNTNGTNDKLDAIVGAKTDRGYTMHEHLDEIGVIHMNARVYDPLIGRFMSADSWIDKPLSLQSYNRYGYVHNNPLRYTDPTGHELFPWDSGDFYDRWDGPPNRDHGGFSGGGASFDSGRSTESSPSERSLPETTVIEKGETSTLPTTTVVEPGEYYAFAGAIPAIGSGAAMGAAGAAGAPNRDGKPPARMVLPRMPQLKEDGWLNGLLKWLGAVMNVDGASSGDKDPSTPTGQRGSPIDVKPGTNEPTTIDGRDYSGHSIDQMQGRGVPPSAVEDAIRNGSQTPGNTSGTTVNTGSDGRIVVITNDSGRVITVITK